MPWSMIYLRSILSAVSGHPTAPVFPWVLRLHAEVLLFLSPATEETSEQLTKTTADLFRVFSTLLQCYMSESSEKHVFSNLQVGSVPFLQLKTNQILRRLDLTGWPPSCSDEEQWVRVEREVSKTWLWLIHLLVLISVIQVNFHTTHSGTSQNSKPPNHQTKPHRMT